MLQIFVYWIILKVMEAFVLLFTLSFPVFYIWGIVSFLRSVFRKTDSDDEAKNSTNADYSLVEQLKQLRAVYPEATTVDALINALSPPPQNLVVPKPLTSVSSSVALPDQTQTPTVVTPVAVSPATISEDTISGRSQSNRDWWSSWYEDNSINLLLYIGAFLVVASAVTFISLTWDTVGGLIKALILSAGCVGFFATGFLSLSNPRIKQAAYTFIGIGALLIPLTGIGWHLFVLAPTGVTPALSWLVTSLFAILVYVYLAKTLQVGWYVYAGTLSVFSLALSFVRINSLADSYYVLAAMFSCFLYMAGSLVLRRLPSDQYRLFDIPLSYTAEILMPLSLVFGLISVTAENMLFSFDTSLALILATLYYMLTYYAKRSSLYFAVCSVLWLVFVLVFTQWLKVPQVYQYFIFFAQGAVLIVATELLERYGLHEESQYSLLLGYLASGGAFLSAPISLTIQQMTLLGGLLTGLIAYQQRSFLSQGYMITNVSLPLAYLLIVSFITENNSLYPLIFGVSLSMFYAGAYSYFKKAAYSYICSLVSLFSIYLFTQYFSFSLLQSMYLFCVAGLLLLVVSHLARMKHCVEEWIFHGWLSVIILLALWLLTYMGVFTLADSLLLFCIQTILLIYSSYVLRQIYVIGLPVFTLAYLIYFYGTRIGAWSSNVFGLVYLMAGTGMWGVALFLHNHKKVLYTGLISGAFYCLIGLWHSFSSEGSLVTALSFLTVLLFATAVVLKSREWFIGFLFVSLWFVYTLLGLLNINAAYYPFLFILIAYGWYGLHYVQQGSLFEEELRYGALILNGVAPLVYGFSLFESSQYNNVEMQRVLTMYTATILFVIDGYLKKSDASGYIGSAYGLFAYFASIRFLNISESQFYTLALGLYFTGIGYHREQYRQDTQNSQAFYLIGMCFILLPTFTQMWGLSGIIHALLMVVYGLGYVAFGISRQQDTFKKIGFSAIALGVFSQFYGVLTSNLYLTLAMIGIGILALAVWLANNRKE